MSLRRSPAALGAATALVLAFAIPQSAAADHRDDHQDSSPDHVETGHAAPEAGSDDDGPGGGQGTTQPAGPAVGDDGKVWVCKFVRTPGGDEELKPGKNPIHVDANTLRNELEDIENIEVGDSWTDAQERSEIVSGPDAERCQPPAEENGDEDDETPPNGDETDDGGDDEGDDEGDTEVGTGGDDDSRDDEGDTEAGTGDDDSRDDEGDTEVGTGGDDDSGDDEGDTEAGNGDDDSRDDEGDTEAGTGDDERLAQEEVAVLDRTVEADRAPADGTLAGTDAAVMAEALSSGRVAVTATGDGEVEVLAAVESRDELPRTGVSMLALALSGLLALGVGTTTVARARRAR